MIEMNIVAVRENQTTAHRPYNYYSWLRAGEICQSGKREVLWGPLGFLAQAELAKLPFSVPRPIHTGRLYELFNKQTPGLMKRTSDGYGEYWIRKGPFAKWIRRNANKICKTVAETESV
jgi:hypothetical protein